MDDRMLDGDRVLWFIGGSPERAREALAAGHAWTPEQRAQLEQIAASAGYSPQQPTGYPPAQQQVPRSGARALAHGAWKHSGP